MLRKERKKCVRFMICVKNMCEKNSESYKIFRVYRTKNIDCIEKNFSMKNISIRTYKMRCLILRSIYLVKLKKKIKIGKGFFHSLSIPQDLNTKL